MLDLAAKRQKLDDTISKWSIKSKKTSSKELNSRKIKKTALKKVFLLRALFSSIGKRKFDKTFINTQLLANNYTKEKVDLSLAIFRCPPAVKLNRPYQI